MIDRDHKLPLARQAKAVGISRGSIYYRPRPVGETGPGLMRLVDDCWQPAKMGQSETREIKGLIEV